MIRAGGTGFGVQIYSKNPANMPLERQLLNEGSSISEVIILVINSSTLYEKMSNFVLASKIQLI